MVYEVFWGVSGGCCGVLGCFEWLLSCSRWLLRCFGWLLRYSRWLLMCSGVFRVVVEVFWGAGGC